MLKIKDEVNLKELEKFGFNISLDKNYYNNTGLVIRGDKISRKGLLKGEVLMPHCLGHSKSTLDDLYDLIKANLVEKVEE